jgi:hypothetical protein
MHRRHFLSSTILGGAAILGAAGSAKAFTMQSCGDGAAASACNELERHHQLLAELKQKLDAMHLTPAQEQAVMANAVCPFCGEPLIG